MLLFILNLLVVYDSLCSCIIVVAFNIGKAKWVNFSFISTEDKRMIFELTKRN